LFSQSNDISDLLGSLTSYFDEDRADRREIHRKLDELQNTTDEIKTKTEDIDSKMDLALEKLNVIENAFLDLKRENRDLEEKLTLMSSKLSRLEVRDEDLEDYYALAQSLYMNWEDFDLLTKSFLPLAEYLYSKLQKYEKPDYSPVILELCRAIENEFLSKIFTKYTFDLLDRKGEDIDVFLSIDKSSEDLKCKTASFAKTVTNARKTRKPTFTLGQMNVILSMSKSTKTVSKSPLLKDFVDYLNDNTEASSLLDDRYIQKINDIVENYRNPSAHPEYMTLEKANECREIMPDRIDYLIDCLAI
jgi:archaellum component FlaC